MALKTEIQYEDLFGDLITALTGLDRATRVRPMKQQRGTRVVERIGNLLKGLKASDNFCTYHVKFSEGFEEPFTTENQSKVYAKRFLRVEYNFYGPEAANNLLKMKQLHYTQKAADLLIINGIVYETVFQNAIDMDENYNGEWWTRRNFSINYLESVEIEFPAAAVEEVAQTEVIIEKIN